MILRLEPRGSLALANELASHPEVAVAAVTGSISVDKAKAIHSALGTLQGLSEPQLAQATRRDPRDRRRNPRTATPTEVTRWATPIRRFLDTAPDRGSMMGA